MRGKNKTVVSRGWVKNYFLGVIIMAFRLICFS